MMKSWVHSRQRTVLLGLVAAALIICAGCGDSDEAELNANLRFINANPFAPLFILEREDKDELLNLSYGNMTAYQDEAEGSLELLAVSQSSPVAPAETSVSLRKGSYTTVIIGGTERNIEFTILSDELEKPEDDSFRLRVVNMAPSADNIDIHLVNPGFSVSDTDPAMEDVGFEDESDYIDGYAGTLRVVGVRQKTGEIVFDSGLIELLGETVYSYVLIDWIGGGLPIVGVLVEDKD